MNYQYRKEFMMEQSGTNEYDQIVYFSHGGGPLRQDGGAG